VALKKVDLLQLSKVPTDPANHRNHPPIPTIAFFIQITSESSPLFLCTSLPRTLPLFTQIIPLPQPRVQLAFTSIAGYTLAHIPQIRQTKEHFSTNTSSLARIRPAPAPVTPNKTTVHPQLRIH